MQSLIGSRQIAKEPEPLGETHSIKETSESAFTQASQESFTHMQHSKQVDKSCEMIHGEQEKEAVSSPSYQEREGKLDGTVESKQFEIDEKDPGVEVRVSL